MTRKTDASPPTRPNEPAPKERKKAGSTAPSTPLSILEAERKAHEQKNER